MKRRGKIICAACLLLAALFLYLGAHTFYAELDHFSFRLGPQRFTIKTKYARFGLWTSPPQADDPASAQLLSQISNQDFSWTSHPTGFAEGIVRANSPTWKLCHDLRDKFNPSPHSLLRLMDDPNRFLSAHLLLLSMAENRRTKYFHLGRTWRKANFRKIDDSLPADVDVSASDIEPTSALYIAADATGAAPDLSLREYFVREWHDVLDEPQCSIAVGWIIFALLLLPTAALARPKWRPPTLPRWVLNWLALILSTAALISASAWIRSLAADDGLRFASTPSPTSLPGFPLFHRTPFIASSKGELIFLETDEPGPSIPTDGPPIEYEQRPTLPTNAPLTSPLKPGESHVKLPGIEFRAIAPAARPLPRGFLPLLGNPGARWLSIRWWLLTLVLALPPATWLGKELLWRLRVRRRGMIVGKICFYYGYDMRATPDRCPECGKVPTRATDQTPVPL